jgi:hypothetical protein
MFTDIEYFSIKKHTISNFIQATLNIDISLLSLTPVKNTIVANVY